MTAAGLVERLRAGETVVADGAWGTQIVSRAALPPGRPPEEANLEAPEVVAAIGREYVAAGAAMLTTNTFGASPLRLAHAGLADRCETINRRGVERAREAAGARALVCGSVGPSGKILAPLGDAPVAEVEASFERQITVLAEAGIDLFCIETMTDLAEAALAVRACRRVAPGIPVIATMTFDVTPRGIFTVMGITPARAAAGLSEAGAEVIGANCGNGIEAMAAVVAAFARHTTLPLAVRPNAGLPELVAGSLTWPETPEFFARRARGLVAAGARLVGGCCGTTPDHIAAVIGALGR